MLRGLLHKGTAVLFVGLFLVVSLLPRELSAQRGGILGFSGNEIVWGAAGGLLFLVPRIVSINESPSGCGPCDTGPVPGFDRWAIREVDGTLDDLGTGLVVGMAALAWIDLLDDGTAARPELAASLQAASWAVGVNEILKAVVARKRPILYTTRGADPGVRRTVDNRRSFASGHTAAAFAVAVSYYLAGRRLNKSPEWPRWVLLAAAAGTGVLRVASGRHFPSDVVAGAALGSLSAVVVHTIRF